MWGTINPEKDITQKNGVKKNQAMTAAKTKVQRKKAKVQCGRQNKTKKE